MTDVMTDQATAKLTLDNGESIDLPVMVGSENEHAVDISKLRGKTGYITLDEGYGNTGACTSGITFINGEKGILRYRGIPIEQVAAKSSFVETCYLLIYGELPTQAQLDAFSKSLGSSAGIHESMRHHFQGFPDTAHPMATLSSMINAVSCFHPDIIDGSAEFDTVAARLISKVRTIAAFAYKATKGEPPVHPRADLDYCSNFLNMMFSTPGNDIELDPDVVQALNLILILHAEHEQNCSTSTVRMVCSSGANLFASVSAGVCALWGWRHGGANVAVLDMLDEIVKSGVSLDDYVTKVKNKETKLMGFGHRVYKNFDPRAKILAESADKILTKLGVDDPLLDLARRLQDVALEDSYFVDRNLYPNVDFYSGIIMRAMGIPTNMFTVMFAIGRMPGWIAQWKELRDDPTHRISRPRQVYTGPTERDYVPMDQR